MNELINWVALNNTLMIRIGFSAVLLLLIAYVFRYFFVPKIDVVTQAEEAAATEELAAAKDAKSINEIPAEIEQGRTEEIINLKAEVETLKSQIQTLPKATGVAAATAAASAPPAANTAAAAPVNENALVTKIQTLEARLSEYEIIAEEIAEIGLLREENAAMKAKLAAAGSEAAPSVEVPLVEEPAADGPDSKYDAYEKVPPPEPESQLVITSEVEVSLDEQALINDFEEMIRKKG